MKRDVFISYNSASYPIVEKLVNEFEHNNISCWFAPRNLNEDGLGKEFDDEIVDAIKESSAVIVVLNDLALKSKWVKREVTQAEKQGKRIMPFVIDKLTANNGFAMRLSEVHCIPAYPEPEKKIPILLSCVQHMLGKTGSSAIDDASDALNVNTRPVQIDKSNNSPNLYDLDFEEGIAFLEAEEDMDAFLAFLRSAEKRNTKAYEQLFKIMHRNNKNSNFLDEETWEHIEDLSDAGEGFADLLMHYRYFGMGTQNDIAIMYLKRALDKQVSPFAFLQMGICYGWGMGVQFNDVLRMHYYRKAYDAGCWEATRYLAQEYLYGNEKVEKDLAKAEVIAKEGAEKGVRECYTILNEIYRAGKRVDETRELAQYMIDNHIYGGYCLMGDYFLYGQGDFDSAKKWFQQATEHNEKRAWGSLGYLSFFEENDIDEAFLLAQRGVYENDSYSYWLLGHLYKQKGNKQDLAKSWNYFMTRTHIFGTYIVHAADLYLVDGYKPTENQLVELKHYLALDAQRHDYESAIALIKIILLELLKVKTDNSFEKKIQCYKRYCARYYV